jgi:hypothetical protein
MTKDQLVTLIRDHKDYEGRVDEFELADSLIAALASSGTQADGGKGEAVGVAGSMPGTDGFTMAAFKVSDVPVGTKLYDATPAECAPRAIPSVCDGKEQDEFEAWAQKEKYDMSQHPLHWLFLNERTYAARQGWKAALEYVERAIEQAAKENQS